MIFKLCISLLLFISLSSLEAQLTFEKTYGSDLFEEAKSIRQTSDGGYIIGGTNLVKIDAEGIIEWTKPYPSEFANPTNDQGYILVKKGDDITFTKTMLNGDTIWQTYYTEGSWANEGEYIEQVDDGGYIVAGRFQSVTGSGMLLLKLNSQGNKVWRRTFTEPTSASFCNGFSAQQTLDNGYIIAGTTQVNFYDSTRHTDVFIVKTDTLGAEQWRKYFGGDADDSGISVRQNSNGNYFIAGTSNSYSQGTGSDLYLIKLNSSGDSLWTKTFGGTLDESAGGLWPTLDGGCVVVGQSNSFPSGDSNGYIIKTDEDGNTMWTKIYGLSGDEGFYFVQQTSDSGFIISGYTNSIGSGDKDMWILKTDSLGNIDEVSALSDYSNSINYTISPNPSDNVFHIDANPSNPLAPIHIEVYNQIGMKILDQQNKRSISLEGCAPGLYFVKVSFEKQSLVQKILLKR
jgi:hypothetical protein